MTTGTVPHCQPFRLFGMGSRRKFLYQGGQLKDALTGELIRAWNVRMERFVPSEYRVELETNAGLVVLSEDAEAVWLQQSGDREALARSTVRLPAFANHSHAPLLRALHAELLINLMPSGPVPNLWVYPRPWYRDAAMMALCFEQTGNVDLIEPWIMGLVQPYDYNNQGTAEPDNLGQVLFLAGLVGATGHPIIATTLKEIARVRQGNHLTGTTDFQAHPVYQTKWLKYGLRRLGLADPYEIPAVPDSYSSLFWMDYRDQHQPHPRFPGKTLEKYPYLNWAEAHFYNDAPPESMSADAFPLTREIGASEAAYSRMGLVSEEWAASQWGSPHTWHAAEMFLYFLHQPQP